MPELQAENGNRRSGNFKIRSPGSRGFGRSKCAIGGRCEPPLLYANFRRMLHYPATPKGNFCGWHRGSAGGRTQLLTILKRPRARFSLSMNTRTVSAALIRVCAASRHARALWLALSRLPVEERDAQIVLTMAAMKSGKVTWDGLWEATRNEQLVGALWSYRMPGRIAAVWPPQITDGESEETRNHLIQDAIADLRTRQVRMAQ